MAQYWITHSRKDGTDPDYRLDAFMINGQVYPIDDVIRFIELGGHEFLVTDRWGNTVKVIIETHPRTKRKYLTTPGDGIAANNLMNLPDC
jgi:uncharacterized protein DUF3892